ncbi:IclR family transcriptional regulator [Nocardia sp. NPDC004860]|uniref:IclR family transcriptional regulator n=1 Tax=Nocardia sp. NPDC004860 TaxID=3154557 RepID=UPI0033B6532F
MPPTNAPGRSVTSRSLALLAAFDTTHRRLGLTELATRASMPLATAHRLVGELVAFGALARTGAGDYVIGRRLWDLGLLAPVQGGLVETASPFLHDLFGATHATVHLAVRDGTRVLYLDRLRGSASVPILSTIGSRLPLHATAVGKVLLAHAPADVVEFVLADLHRVTSYTVTSSVTLRRQLDRIRRDGYATTSQEMSLGACSVAVPIRHDGRVVAALGIVVPSLRAHQSRLVGALRVAARGVERSL